MPLFYQHNINDTTKIGIWKIEEEEAFFLQQIAPARDITHPHKRLQHLAGRYLLSVLFEDFPVDKIQIAENNRPFLEDASFQFSISHCGDYAAAIVSREDRVGVDIELIDPKIEKIKDKFLSREEQLRTYNLELITTSWAIKEAVYKWYGKGAVDFRKHIQLSPDLSVLFCKEEPIHLQAETKLFDDLVLAFVIQ